MSESTRSTSIETSDSLDRVAGLDLLGAGCAGTCSATYFSPNRVLGMICAVTLAGMVSQGVGEDARA